MVLATQNPIEHEGTYPLPEAQLDRFMMWLHLGYPELADEAKMLSEQALADPLETLVPVADGDEIRAAIAAAKSLHVEESLNRYVVALLRHTRSDGRVVLGNSPRSGIAVMRVAKTRALCAGRDFVTPDDIKAVVEPVLVAPRDPVARGALHRHPVPTSSPTPFATRRCPSDADGARPARAPSGRRNVRRGLGARYARGVRAGHRAGAGRAGGGGLRAARPRPCSG